MAPTNPDVDKQSKAKISQGKKIAEKLETIQDMLAKLRDGELLDSNEETVIAQTIAEASELAQNMRTKHVSFSSTKGTDLRNMGVSGKSLNINWDALEGATQKYAVSDIFKQDSKNKSQIFDMETNEAGSRVLIDNVLTEAILQVLDGSDVSERSGNSTSHNLNVDRSGVVITTEHKLPAATFTSVASKISYRLTGTLDYMLAFVNPGFTISQVKNPNHIRELAQGCVAIIEAKSVSTFNDEDSLHEVVAQVISAMQTLMPTNFKRMKFVLTNGFQWKFGIWSSKASTYYVTDKAIGPATILPNQEFDMLEMKRALCFLTEWLKEVRDREDKDRGTFWNET